MANTNYPSSSKETTNTPTPHSNGSKNVMIGLLATALLGTWGYMLWSNNSKKDVETVLNNAGRTETVMTELDSLRQLFNLAEIRLDSITETNNDLQGKNSALQKEIKAKKSEIGKILSDKNATAADLKRARQLISELNGQIGRLEAQITQLKGENQELTARNAHLSSEKDVLSKNLEVRTAENDELANVVDVASTLSASGMAITPLHEKRNGKEKETRFAKRVDKLQISFNIENRITSSGPADLYVIITDPGGVILQNPDLGSGAMTTRQDGDRNYTVKISVEYETGTKKSVSFSVKNGTESFKAGDYKIEVYHNGFKIGEGIKSLKKGLFG